MGTAGFGTTAESRYATLNGRHVFLSAGLPGRQHQGDADRDEIAAAVGAVVSGLFRAGGRLLFGGQPDVVPLVLAAGQQLAGKTDPPPVTLYQSALYADMLPAEVQRLAAAGLARVELTEAAPGDRPERGRNARSLATMRAVMLSKENDPAAGIFIGGLDGVASEFELFRDTFPGLPAYVFGGPGGEARRLALAGIANLPVSPLDRELATSHRYDALIAEVVLDIADRTG